MRMKGVSILMLKVMVHPVRSHTLFSFAPMITPFRPKPKQVTAICYKPWFFRKQTLGSNFVAVENRTASNFEESPISEPAYSSLGSG
jgi:hypothetical protein